MSASGRDREFIAASDSGRTAPKVPAGIVACIGASLCSLNLMGAHHKIQRQRSTSRAVEQGQDRGLEGPVQGQGHLGTTRSPADGKPRKGARPFNLGIDSKLRGCDLVSLKVRDVCHGDQVASRAVVMQYKTQRPVQFEITRVARDVVPRVD